MTSIGNFKRLYEPEDLKIMMTAFDRAHSYLPSEVKGNDRARRRLAFIVMRHHERGDDDPEQLAASAARDFLR
jgi:hypothetical protein